MDPVQEAVQDPVPEAVQDPVPDVITTNFNTYVSDKAKDPQGNPFLVMAIIAFWFQRFRKVIVLGSGHADQVAEASKTWSGMIQIRWNLGILPHNIVVTTAGKTLEERVASAATLSKMLLHPVYPVSKDDETRACVKSAGYLIDYLASNDQFRDEDLILIVNFGGSTANAALVDAKHNIRIVEPREMIGKENISTMIMAGIPSVAMTNVMRDQIKPCATDRTIYEMSVSEYQLLEESPDAKIKDAKRGKVYQWLKDHGFDEIDSMKIYISGRP